MHPFGLAGHAEVKVWTHYTLEADSMDVLVTTVTDHTRMSRTSLVWVLGFTCCLTNKTKNKKYGFKKKKTINERTKELPAIKEHFRIPHYIIF